MRMLLLATLLGISPPNMATAAPPPVPTALVIISCKVDLTGEFDKRTGWVGMEWHFEHSEMQCKREVMVLEDAALKGTRPEGNILQGDSNAAPLNPDFSEWSQCARAAMSYAPEYNRVHPGWSVYKVGCPNPIFNSEGKVVGFKMPECPNTVKCKFDESVI